MKRAQKGFTLIEIMIVVAIIAILAAVAIPNFISYRKTSQANACVANMKSIIAAEEAYAMKKGDYTTTLSDLVVIDDKPGFLKSEPICPLAETGDDGKKVSTYTLAKDTKKGITITCTKNTDTDYPHVLEDAKAGD